MSKDRKDTTYQQCRMTKDNREHIAWIPSEFAQVGKVIDIDGLGKGWTVTVATNHKIDNKAADSMSQMYKKTRKASDI